MIHMVSLFSRQGKIRLCKFYNSNLTKSESDKKKILREMVSTILSRTPSMSCFVEWRDYMLVYKRYASLYFLFVVDKYGVDNELIILELIHRFVEVLDQYFGAVCELDIIYNFEKAYFLLDEMIMAGEILEPSRKAAVKYVHFSDQFQEDEMLYNAVSDTARL
uniref:AP complex subunit sigma n=1 Tax=Caligus clemensi TaxID=344056 RepID=C1C066_CALCM|nr:AP-1 complex subunit sigma-1A [Caligus clemensi]